MVYCNHCRENGIKIKLKYYPEDESHPFKCPECKNENWYIDERTGRVTELGDEHIISHRDFD